MELVDFLGGNGIEGDVGGPLLPHVQLLDDFLVAGNHGNIELQFVSGRGDLGAFRRRRGERFTSPQDRRTGWGRGRNPGSGFADQFGTLVVARNDQGDGSFFRFLQASRQFFDVFVLFCSVFLGIVQGGTGFFAGLVILGAFQIFRALRDHGVRLGFHGLGLSQFRFQFLGLFVHCGGRRGRGRRSHGGGRCGRGGLGHRGGGGRRGGRSGFCRRLTRPPFRQLFFPFLL